MILSKLYHSHFRLATHYGENYMIIYILKSQLLPEEEEKCCFILNGSVNEQCTYTYLLIWQLQELIALGILIM